MKNIMFGVITIVVLLVGSVYIWSTIQDQNFKKETVASQQEKTSGEKQVEEADTVTDEVNTSEEEHRTLVKEYYLSLVDHVGQVVFLEPELSANEKNNQLDLVLEDVNHFYALKPPLQYESQHNQILGYLETIEKASITAQNEEDVLTKSLTLGDPEIFIDTISNIMEIVKEISPFTDEQPLSNETLSPISYLNCDDARAQGATPVYYNDPGYSSTLDRDGDGVGCEEW